MMDGFAISPDPGAENGVAPLNLDAERAVLGALLLNPVALLDVENRLKPSYFTREAHRVIYGAMLALHEKRLDTDPVALVNELRERDHLETAGGEQYLDFLTDSCPTSVNAGTYARIVERKALLRLLMLAADEIKETARAEKEDIDAIIDKAERAIFRISQNRVQQELMPLERIMPRVMADLSISREGAAVGLPTGFAQLDELLGGFNRNDLLILAARPGMGKSGFALTLAQHIALQLKAHVGIFSLEMGADQVCQRLLAMETSVNLHQLRTGHARNDQWQLVTEASERMTQARLYIDDTPGASIADIRGKARRLHAQIKLDMLIVDYLQLMSGTDSASARPARENRQQEITYISSSLKNLARELEIPVLALSQLSRAVESRQDKRPMLQDLRESGSIEQDADIVMFLYRDDYYNEDSLDPNLAELIVAKHRNGALGRIKFFFRKETTAFRELARVQQSDAGDM